MCQREDLLQNFCSIRLKQHYSQELKFIINHISNTDILLP